MTIDIRDKLYDIFIDRFDELVRIWTEKPSRKTFTLEDRKEIERKWEEYLSKIGASQLGWSTAMRYDQTIGSFKDVLIRNPCERPEEFYMTNPSVNTYILLPREVAEKILVLGALP